MLYIAGIVGNRIFRFRGWFLHRMSLVRATGKFVPGTHFATKFRYEVSEQISNVMMTWIWLKGQWKSVWVEFVQYLLNRNWIFTNISVGKSDMWMTQTDIIITQKIFADQLQRNDETNQIKEERRKRVFSYRRLDFKWTLVEQISDPGIHSSYIFLSFFICRGSSLWRKISHCCDAMFWIQSWSVPILWYHFLQPFLFCMNNNRMILYR